MNKDHDNSNSENNEKNPFSMPEGYFNSFSKKMMLKIELADELKEFKMLSSIDKKSPFVTPENYFIKSMASAEIRAELSGYETLASVGNKNAFVVPPLYFERSHNSIINKIELAEELQQYSALHSVEKQNPFVIPEGYFDTLSHTVREKIHTENKAQAGFGKVIQFVFSKRTIYALAAMMVLSLGLYFYTSNNEVTGNCNGLACLDRSEILKSNQINNLDEESLMNLVDVEKLSKNLDNASATTDKKEETDFVKENADINDL